MQLGAEGGHTRGELRGVSLDVAIAIALCEWPAIVDINISVPCISKAQGNHKLCLLSNDCLVIVVTAKGSESVETHRWDQAYSIV
jgi:hypothetical protein